MPLKDHRIALLGAGSAGCGISEQLVQAMINQGLSEAEARSRFYLVDRMGLLHEGMETILPFQKGFVRSENALKTWSVNNRQQIGLFDVINNAKPTILLGVSGQPNQFTEPMIRAMASYCDRPIVFPLSNPTSRVEATPHQILEWSAGRALVATGSPFEPVTVGSHQIEISQCNNSYIFPGVGLGVVAGKARRVSDKMMMAAAMALSDLSPAMIKGEGALLPELKVIRDVSRHIAKAVILQAIKEKHADKISDADIETAIKETMWYPEYQVFTS